MKTHSGTRPLRRAIGLFIIATANIAMGAESPVPGGCDTPASARTSEIGCYFVASEELGALPAGAQYWHVYTFATRAAAEAARGPRATVAESFGKVWLYTLAEQSWRPAGGERAAVIGPLGITPGRNYTARYMEATFTPGMKTPAHHHPGPEAWYVVSGTQCLETPDGVTVAHAGQGAYVREGPPMVLSSIGSETRRAVLLILHDASRAFSEPNHTNWTSRGLCPP